MHPIFHVLGAARRGAFVGGGYCHGGDREGAEVRFGHRKWGGHWGGNWGGPWGGHWGGGGWGGPPQGGRRSRVRRGDVRAAILALLAEQPRNGYQLIQEIGDRSGGVWKPSPGAIYPALQQLEDEGLIWADNSEGKRIFSLTKAGEDYLRDRPEEASPPWEGLAADMPEDLQDLQALLGQVMAAGVMVAQAATPEQMEKARHLLNQTRKGLYQILAEDSEE